MPARGCSTGSGRLGGAAAAGGGRDAVRYGVSFATTRSQQLAEGGVKLQRKPTDYLRNNFAVSTSGMDDPAVLQFVLGKLGAENVMFAIDYPYEDSTTATRFLSDAPLTPEQRGLVSHGNAERLFRIKPVTA